MQIHRLKTPTLEQCTQVNLKNFFWRYKPKIFNLMFFIDLVLRPNNEIQIVNNINTSFIKTKPQLCPLISWDIDIVWTLANINSIEPSSSYKWATLFALYPIRIFLKLIRKRLLHAFQLKFQEDYSRVYVTLPLYGNHLFTS